jgi:hypothetical protein
MHARLSRRIGLLALPVALLSVLSASRGDAAGPAADPQGARAARTADPSFACQLFSATNGSLQTRVVTSSDPRLYLSTDWTDLDCGTLRVSVPRGRHGLVTVGVDAEVTCTGVAGHWCLGQVLIGGAAGEPIAPEPDSFAWAHSDPDPALWESNAFTRTRVLTCPSNGTSTVCVWTVRVQVRNHMDGLVFRVDDSTVKAEVTYY